MIAIWVIVIFLALYFFTKTSGFMQEPLQLSPGNENVLKFQKILSSCGNAVIPWKTCKDAFEGLPWQMSSMFAEDLKPQMCNSDGTINKQKLRKFISCPK